MSAAIISATVAVASLAYAGYQSKRSRDRMNYGADGGAGADSYSYDQDGNLVNASIWVPDSSAAGGHFEYRDYGTLGKEPDKPAAPTAPDPRSYDQGAAPDENYMRGEDSPEYQSALSKYNADLAKYNNETLPAWQKDHDLWQKKKDDYERNKAQVAEIEGKTLENLNMSMDQRLENFAAAEKAFADQQHAQIDPQFQEAEQRIEEGGMATGMSGSRSEADRLGLLDKTKSEADLEIARSATMYKYSLANMDLSNNLATLGAIRDYGNADFAKTIQRQGMGLQQMVQGNQVGLANQVAGNNSAYQRWLASTAMNNQSTQNLFNTASGLAFLYGYMNKPTTPKIQIQPYGNMNSWPQGGSNIPTAPAGPVTFT